MGREPPTNALEWSGAEYAGGSDAFDHGDFDIRRGIWDFHEESKKPVRGSEHDEESAGSY